MHISLFGVSECMCGCPYGIVVEEEQGCFARSGAHYIFISDRADYTHIVCGTADSCIHEYPINNGPTANYLEEPMFKYSHITLLCTHV